MRGVLFLFILIFISLVYSQAQKIYVTDKMAGSNFKNLDGVGFLCRMVKYNGMRKGQKQELYILGITKFEFYKLQ